MLFAIACGSVESHNGFRFQIKYFGVLKTVLPCVSWMAACKMKFVTLSKKWVSFVTLRLWIM